MIDWLFAALHPLFRAVYRHARTTLLVSLALTGIGLWFALQLRIDNDFSRLIPSSYPSVQALNALRENVGGESEVAVVIESPSFDANRRFAEDLIPAALALTGQKYAEPYLTRVEYRRDVRFLQENALYFATTAELDSLEAFLRREIRDAKLEANPFYVELDDDPAADTLADDVVATLQSAYDDLVRSEYPISADSTTMVVRFYPGSVQTDIDYVDDLYRDLEDLTDALRPASYHTDMRVTLAGRFMRQLVEVRAITDDVMGSFGAGVLTLLLMVMAYFLYKSYQTRAGAHFSSRVLLSELARTPITALVLGLPLLASITWTFGIVYAAYGSLNIMTSTLGLVLFGLGIDFGIHFYARYAEERGRGHPVARALDTTFETTGKAIAAVAITTAAAFYILMVADFRGFSQFGFTAGTGTLFALIAMLTLLPALLAFFEETRLLHLASLEAAGATAGTSAYPDSSAPPSMAARPEAGKATNGAVNGASHGTRGGGPWRARSFNRRALPSFILAVSLGATVFAAFHLDDVRFEYDFGELEPRYETYEALKQLTRRVYSSKGSRNAAYILTDTPKDAAAVARILRARAAADTTTPTIGSVETLHDRFPMDPDAQQAKLRRLAEVRALLNDPFLQQSEDAGLERLRRAASTEAPIRPDQLPPSLADRFLTKSGDLGNIVIVTPSVGLADGRNSMMFADDVGTVELANGTVYHAGSTSIVASDMLRLMIREAPLMVVLTIALVVIFKFIILRRVWWVLIALVPLAASFLWMFGLMVLFGLSLNFYNLVVLPTVLGIGDDSGIHIVHRYLEEGRGSIRRVLRSTGEHISISAVTTMVGFGGFVLSVHPGLASIGWLAVIGIGMTLIAALVTLPALIQWLEKRRLVQPPTTRLSVNGTDRSRKATTTPT